MSERFVNPAVAAIPPSGIRRFFSLAGAVKNAISLGIGEPDFVTPYALREAMIESLLAGETQYTENAGLKNLRGAIAEFQFSRNGLAYDPDREIVVTIGASEAIDIVLRAVLRAGDEVLIPDPGYVSYAPCVHLAGGVPVMVNTRAEDDFQLTVDALRQKATKRTRALILCYPNNPTGAVMTDKYLLPVAEFAKEHDLLVISDEIYNELVYDGFRQTSIGSLPGMRERTVTVNGFSKAFAMTGHRVGYFMAPEAVAQAALKIHQYTILCASRSSQVAALTALTEGKDNDYREVSAMRESYDRRRRLMLRAFQDMGLTCFEPRGAFYMFPSIAATGMTSEEFCTGLLREKQVVCIPGTAFGESGEGYIRCCYATDIDKLKEAFVRMREYLNTVRR